MCDLNPTAEINCRTIHEVVDLFIKSAMLA